MLQTAVLLRLKEIKIKRIVIDLDQTIAQVRDGDYDSALPDLSIINAMRNAQSEGYQIIVFTARGMQSKNGICEIVYKDVLPKIVKWLTQYDIPFDGVIIGKPWCGVDGFYVDDRAIRPSEFASLSLGEIKSLLSAEH